MKRPSKRLSPASPPVHERYAGALVTRRTTTLLAGIRADETTFIAFPCACSRRSVASDESGIIHEAKKLKNHPFVLPLRGQRRLKVLALADLRPAWLSLSPASR